MRRDPDTAYCCVNIILACVRGIGLTLLSVPVARGGYALGLSPLGGDPQLKSLLTAVSGFVGVSVAGSLVAALLGGFASSLLTAALTVWLEHRRHHRALLVAARLVAAELRAIASRLHMTVASGTWRELRARSLAHSEWDEHRSAFAAYLPLERWSDLLTAYRLADAVSAAAASHEELDRLTQVEREEIATAAQAASAAARRLETDSTAGRDGPGHPLVRPQRIRRRHP